MEAHIAAVKPGLVSRAAGGPAELGRKVGLDFPTLPMLPYQSGAPLQLRAATIALRLATAYRARKVARVSLPGKDPRKCSVDPICGRCISFRSSTRKVPTNSTKCLSGISGRRGSTLGPRRGSSRVTGVTSGSRVAISFLALAQHLIGLAFRA